MGAWGAGVYENDDASDWSGDMAEFGLAGVEAALDGVLEAEYVESPDGACAIAAADVVARLVSGGGEDSAYCEGVVAWVVANNGSPPSSLVSKAKHALARVRGEDSELFELWAEDPSNLDEWLVVLSEVEQRLGS
jgi:hypothetical protein